MFFESQNIEQERTNRFFAMSQDKIRKIDPINPLPDIIREAADVIKKGGIVLFPTRCLYGLGADAFNVDAVNKQGLAKGGSKISVAVSQNWFDVHSDYRDSFLNNLQAYNGNHCANIVEGLTDKVNE